MSGCTQNPPLKGILTYRGTPGFDQAFTLVNNPFPMETAESDQDAPVAPLRRVAVVTDSASAIPPEMAAEFGIAIAPMEITIDGRTYVEGPSVSLKTFYRDLVTADKLPTTSAPKPQAWLNAIGEAAKSADSVMCVTLSSNLSAAYDAARVAKDLAQKEHSGTNVRVFDSESAAGSQALIALAAARAAARGDSLDDVESAAAHVRSRVHLVAFLETLKYIHKGGRVPRIAFWATQLLDIKPVLQFSRGRVDIIARPRSRRRAFDRLMQSVRSDLAGKRAHVNVMHADAAEEAALMVANLGSEFDCRELFLTQFHPFMGAHTGPGLVAVAYWAE